jgi:hypothetical protein
VTCCTPAPHAHSQFQSQADPLSLYDREVDRTARQLAAICASMGEHPYVRFSARSKLTQDIASRVENELEVLREALPAEDQTWNPNRAVLLIVDRSLDPVAPLMHEFTYQAALFDLLQLKGDLVVTPGILQETDPRTKKKVDIPVLLDEYDPLWRRFRHEHMGIVGKEVSEQFQQFLKENAAIVKLSSGKGRDEEQSEQSRVEQLKAMSKVWQWHFLYCCDNAVFAMLFAWDSQFFSSFHSLDFPYGFVAGRRRAARVRDGAQGLHQARQHELAAAQQVCRVAPRRQADGGGRARAGRSSAL